MAGSELSPRETALAGVTVLAIGAAAAFWWFVSEPKKAELDERENRIVTLESSNTRARSRMGRSRLEALRQEADRAQRTLTLMRQLVPTGNEVPALLDQVSDAARRTGLEVGGVKPLPVVPGELFDTYRYSISVVGGYHETASFLTSVGSLTRIMTPVNVQVQMGDPGEGRKIPQGSSFLLTEFELQTYVAKSGAVPPPGGAPAAPQQAAAPASAEGRKG